MQREIVSLTGLRGIAAAWVFFFHCYAFALQLDPHLQDAFGLLGAAGYMGVDIFFVLSGFVLALNYADSAAHSSPSRYGGFLWKRLARIYPIHVAALVLLMVVAGLCKLCGLSLLPMTRFSLGGLLKTLTLTNGWSLPIDKTWNTVSWSLSCEWGAYLAFPVLALMAQRFRSRWTVVTMLILLLVALALNLDHRSYWGSMAYGVPRIAVEFPAGILLRRLWVMNGARRTPGGARLALVGLLILIGGGNALATFVRWDAPFPWLPGAACLIVYGLAAGAGSIERWLSSPLAQWAGKISFAFYMIHGFLLGVPERIVDIYHLREAPLTIIGLLLLTACLTVLLAACLYRWIETPLRRVMVAWMEAPTAEAVALTSPSVR
jgi:peptidoglycan/LPS O-acetylase OafA/YrhL